MHAPRIRIALLAALIAVAVACGGGPGGAANDPSGAVTGALNAASSGGMAKLADYACAAHKGDIAAAFGGSDLGSLTAAGIKPEDLFSAFTVAFSNVSTKEVSKTDTTAKVHVTADMKMTIDQAKFKTIMKTVMAAQGLPADDATLDAAITAMSTQFAAGQKLDEDVDVVNEGGKWLICSN
jgi:hypothetical protein